MKKYKLIMIIIVVLLIAFFMWSKNGDGVTVQKYVKEHYMSDSLISSYQTGEDEQYLSESIGLYMKYLLHGGYDEAFREQVDVLKKHFLLSNEKGIYIRWSLDEHAAANALIDDVRIIQALIKGSLLFKEQEYQKLADVLRDSLVSLQYEDGLYRDFSDWTTGEPAERITLSYLTDDFFQTFTYTDRTETLLLNAIDDEDPFFPEYYDISKQAYQYSDEVHMVDQLLIAANIVKRGQELPLFNNWLLSQLEEEGKVFGRYDRNSGKPVVSYESMAVYAFAYDYLLLIGEERAAESMWKHVIELEKSISYEEEHFFDYILFHTVNDFSTAPL
ncbi:hypothetical protein ACQCT6_08505 [Cytobacillus gottheilii]|uniref:Glycosyl hydrolase n=1 Tax=Cytobacillus gottheilii TaxID=859144 RepID=A0ABX8F7C2_9BACI|nr:hypothetical protein [Cytobacillus gottheilii]QVY59995.1 hypothetical protein J1899_13160 [Cytobacillus gottheilii]